MIFKAGIGSDGTGPERYTLRVPFTLSPGSVIAYDQHDSSQTSVGIEGVAAKIEAGVYSYALRVGPFPTYAQAVQFFPKATIGVLWLSLRFRVGINISKSLTPVTLDERATSIAEESNLWPLAERVGWDAVDGHYDSNDAVVIPEHKRLIVWEMGRPTVTVSRSVSDLLSAVAEGLAAVNIEQVLLSSKLKLAVEIYAGSFFEASANSHFLQLVTVLEALIRRGDAPDVTKQAVQELLDTLTQRSGRFDAGPEGRQELERLRSRLGGLKKQTIAACLRRVAGAAVRASLSPGSEDEVADRIDRCYQMRSNMLHEGAFDPSEVASATVWLKEFVPSLLKGLLVGQMTLPA